MRRRMARRLTALLLASVTTLGWLTSSASAFEFFDGRLEAHGYFESQLRFMSRDFQDSPDMTQWYNVFNLEVELDIAPDGFGPFDLLQAYVRAEVRFDCIYIDGCGMWPDQPYGNDPGELPKRLSDGRARLSRGQFMIPNTRTGSNGAYPAAIQFTQDELISPDRKVVGWSGMAATRGLSRVAGADGQTGIPTGVRFNGGDPNLSATTWPSGRCRTNYVNCGNFAGGATQLMGFGDLSVSVAGQAQDTSSFEWTSASSPSPGDPDTDAFFDLASIQGIEPTATGQVGAAALGIDDPWPYLVGDQMDGFTFTQINVRGGGSAGLPMQIMGPWEPKSRVNPNAMVASRSNPFDNYSDPRISQCPPTYPDCASQTYGPLPSSLPDPLTEPFVQFRQPGGPGLYYVNPTYVNPSEIISTGSNPSTTARIRNTPEFQAALVSSSAEVRNVNQHNLMKGGTTYQQPRWLYSPNGTPQASPVLQSAAYNAQLSNSGLGAYKVHSAVYLQEKGFDRVYSASDFNELAQTFAFAQGARQGQIKAQSITGQGAGPYKPIPIVNPGDDGKNAAVARGLWLPHTNLREVIESGKVNNYPFNCSESNRMWNRCDSQKQTKELKEAYFDIEMLDSRLWLRVGKQNIVWGKTELFRTTDQFNPVDVSLATLGSLEESRIPLWAFRGVYSLYEVGPLEDVRVEIAFNYDEFTPVDLGNCGEPYTVNVVCSITFGSALHSLLGIGVAGFNRPPDPWESIKGWEGGARIEFRWDKFSFAISDFYGFSDFPTVNRVVTYERNVDILTGRPLVANAPPNSRCGLATGPENSFFPDPDCLRPGPSRRLQLVNALLPAAEIAQNPGVGPESYELAINSLPFLTLATAADGYKPANNAPYFAQNDAYFADPNDPRNRYANPNDVLYKGDLFRQGAPECSGGTDPANCVPVLYVPQFDPQNLAGTPKTGGPGGIIDPDDVYRDDTGYSEANALDSSPLNQTVFAAVCAGTVGFASLDPSACALNVFSSTNFLPGLGGTQLVSILGKFVTGDTGINTLAGPNIAGVATPLVTLFRDQWALNAPQYQILQTADNFDPTNPQIGQPFPRSPEQETRDDWSNKGLGTAVEDGFIFARELQDYDQAGCFNPYTLNQPYQPGGAGNPYQALGFGRVCDFDDLATSSGSQVLNNTNAGHAQLNSVFTPEQEAILGCGPFFGTNCSQNGIDFLWMELSAVLQTFPGIEGTEDFSGQGWRTDGLRAGEKTMVTGSLSPCADARAAGDDLICRMVNGRETVVQLASPYFGLAEEDIPLLFQGWKDNCSTWLGRTNDNPGDTDPVTGWNCVKRYGQPGTIGARHIGTGEILIGEEAPNELYAGFAPDSDFQNFEKDQAGPRCPTSPFGGRADQVLPGCRRKWANFQGDYVFLTDDLTPAGTPLDPRPNLNLYGRDRLCLELADPTSDVRCSQVRAAAVDPSDPGYDARLATMRPGTVLGRYASARYDVKSWDVTKDGDPDNVGFDSWLLTDLTAQINAFHPAILYRTGHYCHAPAGPNNAGRTGVCNPSNHYGSQRSQSMVTGYSALLGGSVPNIAANPLFPGGGQGVVYSAANGNRYPVAQIYSEIPGEGLQNIWRSNQCNNRQLAPGANYATAQGLPQCAQFQRAAANVAVGPGAVAAGDPFAVAHQGNSPTTFVAGTETSMPVYAQGVGHPFTGQPWSNELAGASWNFLQALVATSAQYRNLGISRALLFDPGTGPANSFCSRSDPFGEKCRVGGVSVSEYPGRFAAPLAYATFDVSDPANRKTLDEIRAIEAELEVLYGNPNTPENKDEINDRREAARLKRADLAPICSLVTTKECGTVSALMGLAGQGPPVVRAGGNGTYGRRCAIWSCGGVITLDYDKRNVLGFGADFAEDYTKSNWGLEWTWIPDVAMGDSASMSGLSRVDTFNLTISVDRPTFVNFLNANRTFFITSQWFFQYIDGYKQSFGSPRGPFNVLGILFIQTGYFQDRLLPKITLVYDVKSVSAATIIDFTYRYNDAFSIVFGAAFFMGREFLTDMSVNPLAYGNRCNGPECGPTYKNSTTPGLGIVRDRDEIFFKLRYTF